MQEDRRSEEEKNKISNSIWIEMMCDPQEIGITWSLLCVCKTYRGSLANAYPNVDHLAGIKN